ncbi:MAG: cupredoxin domain-containing protein [Candidatus Omnitrophota bacterium]|nr:cupredoxin domain-containing protein [Candidatus Omnitrophota bacterium]
MHKRVIRLSLMSLCVIGVFSSAALAKELKTFEIKIKDHRFVPSEIVVPAGEKIKLIIENQDDTPEEFESDSLRREKIIPAHTKAQVFIPALKPGEYSFVGEFHEETAQGKLVAV